ncbi:heme-binding protein [Erythrobacter sp.]|uniref:GlcG/HbpS family heme-binding protein n=1 Tax=Erythrobacter sp. TaxID=1042 RepID=UPI00311DE5EF
MKHRPRRSITLAVSLALIAMPVQAQAGMTPDLPLSASLDAVGEAIRVCDARGFKVTVTVVDLDGIIKVQARSDGSPIHSQQFSFRKAYTMASMGPVFRVDVSSALVKALGASPQGLSNVQSGETPLLFLPGAALIRVGGVPVGAIGVSGAPSSLEDETCAVAAVDKIEGVPNPGAPK